MSTYIGFFVNRYFPDTYWVHYWPDLPEFVAPWNLYRVLYDTRLETTVARLYLERISPEARSESISEGETRIIVPEEDRVTDS
jgi:hypothetical protein